MTVFVVGYCRFSSSNQREESIDAQMRAIEKYCLAKNYTLLRFYCDHARSGTTDKRPEFLKMIEDSTKQEIFKTVSPVVSPEMAIGCFDACDTKPSGGKRHQNSYFATILKNVAGGRVV